MIIKRSIEHLRQNNMYWGEHVLFAVPHAIRMIVGGVMLLIHAFIPGVFRNIGTRVVNNLAKDFKIEDN